MKVLLVNYEYPDVTENCGGGGRVTQLLCDELRDRGHTVTLLTDTEPGHYASYPLRSYLELKDSIATIGPDVVNGHFSIPSSLFLPRICAAADVPYVVSVMGADVFDPTRFSLLRPIADRLNAHVFDGADRIVAPSTDMAERVPDGHSDALSTIHYGIDPDRWTCAPRELHDPLRVLTVCRLVERKNLTAAAETIADLDRAVEWRVVGTGPLEDDLAELPQAETRGYVDDLQSEFDWADVFFLPSRHEAFGMVYLEALASGLPVVASDRGGQTDIVRPDVGATAPPDDTDALADAIETVVGEYDDLQPRTAPHVEERFDASRMADEYEQLYRSVVA